MRPNQTAPRKLGSPGARSRAIVGSLEYPATCSTLRC